MSGSRSRGNGAGLPIERGEDRALVEVKHLTTTRQVEKLMAQPGTAMYMKSTAWKLKAAVAKAASNLGASVVLPAVSAGPSGSALHPKTSDGIRRIAPDKIRPAQA